MNSFIRNLLSNNNNIIYVICIFIIFSLRFSAYAFYPKCVICHEILKEPKLRMISLQKIYEFKTGACYATVSGHYWKMFIFYYQDLNLVQKFNRTFSVIFVFVIKCCIGIRCKGCSTTSVTNFFINDSA